MPVVLIENGAVVQVWRDVFAQAELMGEDAEGNAVITPAKSTLEVFAERYGLSGPEYVEADQPPGMLWDGKRFSVPDAAPVADADRVLSASQFAYLLALTGFDEVWDALEAAAKDADRAQYASLRAERARGSFRLSVTLGVVAKFRAMAAQIAPGVDLSEAAIRAAWGQAEAYQ